MVGIIVVAAVIKGAFLVAEHTEAAKAARRAHRQAHKCVTVGHRGGECTGRVVGKSHIQVSKGRDMYSVYPCYSRAPYEVLEECDDGRRWVPAED